MSEVVAFAFKAEPCGFRRRIQETHGQEDVADIALGQTKEVADGEIQLTGRY